MATPLKDERIELRVTRQLKEDLQTAAAIEGRSVSDFSTTVLAEHAQAVIRRDRELRVEAEQFDAFTAILERPARSVEGLRDLLTRTPVFVD